MKLKIIIMIMLLSLYGCTETSENETNIMNTSETPINLVENINDNEDLVVENNLKDKELTEMDIKVLAFDVVYSLVEASIKVNAFDLSLDDLKLIYKERMTDGVFDNAVSKFKYGPAFIGYPRKDGKPHNYGFEELSGVSLEVIKESYSELINEYNDFIYGEIKYGEIEISKVYLDDYFTFVFTRQKIHMEKTNKADVDGLWTVNDVIHYKKYVLIKKEGNLIVTEILDYIYYEDQVYKDDEDHKMMLEIMLKRSEAYKTFKGESIWSEDY